MQAAAWVQDKGVSTVPAPYKYVCASSVLGTALGESFNAQYIQLVNLNLGHHQSKMCNNYNRQRRGVKIKDKLTVSDKSIGWRLTNEEGGWDGRARGAGAVKGPDSPESNPQLLNTVRPCQTHTHTNRTQT